MNSFQKSLYGFLVEKRLRRIRQKRGDQLGDYCNGPRKGWEWFRPGGRVLVVKVITVWAALQAEPTGFPEGWDGRWERMTKINVSPKFFTLNNYEKWSCHQLRCGSCRWSRLLGRRADREFSLGILL